MPLASGLIDSGDASYLDTGEEVMANRSRLAARITSRPRIETLEPRHLLAAQPILSEFVASNDSTISDGFGNDEDWIEIRNAGDESIDLIGYHLSDKGDDPTKWAFTQSTVLEPGEYLVVFASNEDTIDPLGYWHTNFKLSAGGEYVGLADPNGTTLSEFNAGGQDYPPQLTDVSYGLGGASPETLFDSDDNVQFLVPPNGSLGTSWTGVGFNAAAAGFTTAPGGIGYENSPGATINYNNEINTTVPPGTTSAYVRHEFDLASADAVASMTLTLTYDDGFGLYLNGTYLFGENAPASLTNNSAATGGRNDSIVLSPTEYSLDAYRSLLVDGTNVLAFHALNEFNSSDMLLSTSLSASLESTDAGQVGYLATATPGVPNTGRIDLGPIIREVEFAPEQVAANAPIVVTAEIGASVFALNAATPRLHYRRMFDAEASVIMADDGLGPDEEAGDGVYTATIPGIAGVGEMIRWYITAEDSEGTLSRAPRFIDPNDSAEYFGTVVADPAASDDLPVLYWFVENEAAAQTRAGTKASIFYLGEFYDNIQVDLHGQSTAGPEFLKKSYDFDANRGEKFKIAEDVGRHSDFNLLTNYGDQTKVRHPIAYGAFAEAGGAHHLAYPVSVHRNGEFYALYDFVEQGDSEYLERLGYDPDGALYKVNNNLEDPNSTVINVEKKTRLYEDRSDLQEVVDADDLTGTAAARWDYDNFDTASLVNYLAVQAVIGNTDFGHKNQYLYRDSNETELWQFLPWDTDLTFGHRWRAEVSPPYFDDVLFTNTSVFFGFNDLVQRQYQNTNFREMYFRRIRTLTDHFYGDPGQPVSTGWIYQQFDQQRDLVADEAIQDTAEWGIHPNFSRNPDQAVNQILDTFIPQRRSYLSGLSYIPASQAGSVDVTIDPLALIAGDGPAAEEYFVLSNNESTAVDLSGWRVEGSLTHTFKAGTAIPAGGKLYVVADVQGFQARTSGPRGGQSLIQQGNYDGSLSRFGGTLTLSDAAQTPVDQITYQGADIPGDYNSDGRVDAADYTVWRDSLATEGDLTADGNGDRTVDEADRVIWASNYGATSTGSLSQVIVSAEASQASTPAGEAASQPIGLLSASPVTNPATTAPQAVATPASGTNADALLLAFALLDEEVADDESIDDLLSQESDAAEAPIDQTLAEWLIGPADRPGAAS